MRRAVAFVAFTVFAWSSLAAAADHPITGAKLQLQQSGSGKQKLVFQSKDPTIPFPERNGSDDPRTVGARIEILTPGVAAGDFFEAPSNATQPGWTIQSGAGDVTKAYKYKRAKDLVTTTSIKGIVVKNGRGISIQGDATGIPLDGARGTVAIRITIGNERTCARFTGASVTKDVVGAFLGKGSTTDGFADCALTSLTGAAAACGDGEVNQVEESCDATCDESPGFTCRPPGAVNECTCCSEDGLGGACCNPSSVVVYYPPGSWSCIPTGCAPPDSCRTGDTCQPDESCCTNNDDNLCIQAYLPPTNQTMIGLVPCCPGLECRRAAPPFGAKCCAAGGTACGGDGDCCTGHCQVGGTCEACRAGGAGCADPSECCSGSCSSGTCDACAPTGTFCTEGATCCSGTCSGFECE